MREKYPDSYSVYKYIYNHDAQKASPLYSKTQPAIFIIVKTLFKKALLKQMSINADGYPAKEKALKSNPPLANGMAHQTSGGT